jgi:hypothetical protein
VTVPYALDAGRDKMKRKRYLLLIWLVTFGLSTAGLFTFNFSANSAHTGFGCHLTEPYTSQCVIVGVDRGGAADAAGMRDGDRLSIDRLLRIMPLFTTPKQVVDFEVERAGKVVPIKLTISAQPKTLSKRLDDWHGLAMYFSIFLSTLLIIIAKNTFDSYRWIVPALCVFMVGGVADGSNSYLFSYYGTYLSPFGVLLGFGLSFKFWRSLAEELDHSFGTIGRLVQIVIWLIGVGMIITFELSFLNEFYWGDYRSQLESIIGTDNRISEIESLFWWLFTILVPIACVTAALVLAQRLRGETANRAYWIVTAFCGFFIPWSLGQSSYLLLSVLGLTGEYGDLYNDVMRYVSWLMPISLFAFVYFSLSQRLLSYQFVFNKTVVYLLTGTVLIVAFILLKQNVEVLFAKDSDTQKNIINAALAILVFLAKQLRDVADNTLRKFIFSSVSKRENQLLEFRSKIGHYTTVPALIENMRDELSAFCHHANIEIYESDRRSYKELSAGLEMGFDAEIPVLLRAKRAYVTGGFRSASYRIVFPMFDRNSLIGFVGVQDSSQLPTLRPDEIRLVEKVVRQCATHIALLELDELRKTQRLAVVTSGEGHP